MRKSEGQALELKFKDDSRITSTFVLQPSICGCSQCYDPYGYELSIFINENDCVESDDKNYDFAGELEKLIKDKAR